jgi:hypothetical protein
MNRIGRAIGVGLVAGWVVGCSTGDRAAMLERASATTRDVDRG